MGYWVRAWPPARLPVFVMGLCCGMQRLHAEHARVEVQSNAQSQVQDQEEQPSSKPPPQVCPVIVPVAGCCCLPPVAGLGIYWILATLLCSSVSFACSSFIMLRWALEMFFPILFYDWIYAATDPEQQTSLIARFFASKPMVFLGDNSMCIYMIHLTLAMYIAPLLGSSVGSLPLWSILILVPATVLLGWLLTRFFEKPMARLLRPKEKKGKDKTTEGDERAAEETIGAAAPIDQVALAQAPSPDLVGAPTTVTAPVSS